MSPQVLLSLIHDLTERAMHAEAVVEQMSAQLAERDAQIAALQAQADPPEMPPSNAGRSG